MNADEAYSIIEMMKAYFDDRADVVDGAYGDPRPNKEMQLSQRADEILTWLETLP